MESEILVLLNLFVCLIGAWMCMCRFTKMSARETKVPVRADYILMFSLFVASGISFTYGEPASLIQLLLSFGMVCRLLIGLKVWWHEAPAYTLKLR